MKGSLILWLVIYITNMIQIQWLRKNVSPLCVHGFWELCTLLVHKKWEVQNPGSWWTRWTFYWEASECRTERGKDNIKNWMFFFSVVFQDKTTELIQVDYISASERGWGEEMDMCFSFDLLNKEEAERIKNPYKTSLIIFTVLPMSLIFCVKAD